MVVDGEESVVAESLPAVEDASTESSAVKGEEKSVLDRVKAALAPKEESPASKDTGNEQPKADATDRSSDAELDSETGFSKAELKEVSGKTFHRIRELAARKNDAEAEAERYKPKAEGYDRITAHLRLHDIAPQEFDNAVEVTRLIKHEPERALEVLIPLMQELYRKTGRIIPAELQERVRLGHLQQQDALQITQAQAREQLARENVERDNRRRETADQERQQRSLQERVNSNALAVDQWAKAKAASDPDWLTKQPLIAEAMELELRRAGPNGYPKNGAESVALVERSLAAVETRLKSFQPKPQQIKPVTGQGASPRTEAVPKNAVEAARQALAKLG